MTSSVSALLDVWIPWLTYLGIGIGSENFVVGGLVAAGVAITGFIFQAFRFYYQRTLRTWPKPQAVGILMTWVGNALYVSRIASNKEIASVSILHGSRRDRIRMESGRMFRLEVAQA
jgi:hypothetical protein